MESAHSRYCIQHIVIVLYLLFLLGGFLYSVFRVRLPLMPEPLLQLSYQAMAPYQNYSPLNHNLSAEGLVQGTWKPLDLSPYLPYSNGEKLVRIQMATFNARGEQALQHAYKKWAGQILDMEQKSHPLEALRLFSERWPASPAGIFYLKHSPFMKHQLIVEVP